MATLIQRLYRRSAGSDGFDLIYLETSATALVDILPTQNGGTGNKYGIAPSANKLATSVSISTNLASASSATFDGTTNVSAGVSGILGIINGGTGNSTGTIPYATRLETARTFRVNLASQLTASFDGSANITPGVSGTLSIANGGTGNSLGLASSATMLANSRGITVSLSRSGAGYFNGTSDTTVGVSDVLSVTNGGTGNSLGQAPSADKLTASRTIRTNLGSTEAASFDGTTNVDPGVSGTLGVGNGGTGVTSIDALKSAVGYDDLNITIANMQKVIDELSTRLEVLEAEPEVEVDVVPDPEPEVEVTPEPEVEVTPEPDPEPEVEVTPEPEAEVEVTPEPEVEQNVDDTIIE